MIRTIVRVSGASNVTLSIRSDVNKRLSAWSEGPKAEEGVSPLTAAFNLTNATVGCSLLYLPAAFMETGILPGILISTIVGLTCYYTSGLLVKVAEKTGKSNYEELCREYIGDWAYYGTIFGGFMLCYGACLCYLLTVLDMLSPLLNGFLPEALQLSDAIFTIIFLVPLLMPLSLMKDTSKLSFVSTVKIVVLMSALIIIMITTNRHSEEYVATTKQPLGWSKLSHWKYLYNPGFYTRIGTLIMGFGSIPVMFSVYKTLENPGKKSMGKTNKIGLSFIWACCVLFPLICAIGQGSDLLSQPNILTSSEGDGMISKVLQVAFGIVLLLTYPILCVIAREYVESMVAQCMKGEGEAGQEGEPEVSRKTGIVITLVLMVTHLPFLFLGDAGKLASDMIDIIGGLATTSLSFVFPSLLFWKVFGWRDPTGQRSCKDRVLPLIILTAGSVAVVACPTMRILSMCGIMGNSHSHLLDYEHVVHH